MPAWNLPSEQLAHSAAAALAAWNLPAAHIAQLVEATFTVYVPGAQLRQATAPSFGLYFPGTQLAQLAEADVPWSLPAVHAVHADAPAAA